MHLRNLVVCLAAVFIWGCDDEEQSVRDGAEPTREETSDAGAEQPKKAEGEKKAAPFRLELRDHGLFDLRLHEVPLAKRFDRKSPGPRWMASGRVRNDSAEIVHRGDLFGELSICFAEARANDADDDNPVTTPFDEDGCRAQPGFGRGFELPLSGLDPWKPGTWRHFTVVVGPIDPVYGVLAPERVEAGLRLKARGAFGGTWDSELWAGQPAWRDLHGYAIQKSYQVPANASDAGSVKPGEAVFIEATSGRSVAVRRGGKRSWVPRMLLPGVGEVLESAAEATRYPYRTERDSLVLEIISFKGIDERREHSGDSDRRFLVVDVAVTGLAERPVRLSRNDFSVLMGNQETVRPLPVGKAITPKPFEFASAGLGERHTGTLAFEWPYGAAPLLLQVSLPGGGTVVTIPPGELEP